MKSPSLKLTEEAKLKIGSSNSKVKFVAWKNPLKGWESWVKNLCSTHQSTWKKAGIYEAIMSSVYAIKRHDQLITELASRWCSETNTFVFPWGEATLTLEDMLVLGGFSASGVSALSSLENDTELLKIEEQLELARSDTHRSKAQKALQGQWMEKFRECGSDLEHAAFLSLWLSRCVFHVDSRVSIINKHVFTIAVRLSKGIKIALGPVVLAMLYRDLTILTKGLHFTQLAAQSGVNMGQIDLFALFHLVQIWAWERFPMLQPIPSCMYLGENNPRLARWSNVKILKDKDLRSAIDSAEKGFLWCPYGKHEQKDLQSLGHCVNIVELVGLDGCIERYQPRRVSRQFGFAQEISDDVKLCPPGFAPRIEVINLVVSDSDDDDDDCNIRMTEPLKRPRYETESRRPFPSSNESPYEYEATDSVKTQHPPSLTSTQIKREDIKHDLDSVNESVHETREVEGEVVDTKHDETVEMEGISCKSQVSQTEHGWISDAESYTNERVKNSVFDLEERITRLENIVYAHIKELEAAMRD